MKIKIEPTEVVPKVKKIAKNRKPLTGKVKALAKDTFEKTSTEPAKKIIVSRKYPNWCDAPEDGYRNNTIAQRICYYPEDEKKMESMTKKEQRLYQDFLEKTGRYYIGETLTKEEHEAFMRSLGLDPEQFYIRDNQ